MLVHHFEGKYTEVFEHISQIISQLSLCLFHTKKSTIKFFPKNKSGCFCKKIEFQFFKIENLAKIIKNQQN